MLACFGVTDESAANVELAHRCYVTASQFIYFILIIFMEDGVKSTDLDT